MNRYQRSRSPMSIRHLDPQTLTFSMFNVNDIKNLSVKKITTSESFNMLGHPLIGGLYDPALGKFVKLMIDFISIKTYVQIQFLICRTT